MSKQSKDTGRYMSIGIDPKVAQKLRKADLRVFYDIVKGDGPSAKPVFAQGLRNIIDKIKLDGIGYVLGEYTDRTVGYSREGGSHAFGGPHVFVEIGEDKFERINGIPHAKVRDLEGIVEKGGLYDVEGNLFSDKLYDSINRYDTDLLDDDVFLVEEGGKKGLILSDCSLFGNGMYEGEVNLKRVAGKVCLHIQKDGMEMHISKTGRILYGGWCKKLEEFRIGKRVHGLATDNEGNVRLYSRHGIPLYREKHLRFSNKRIWHDAVGFLLEAYDKEGLIILDRRGDEHYGGHHPDPESKGCTLVNLEADHELLMAFFEPDNLIRYWRFDNSLAYDGAHEKELPAGEEENKDPLVLSLEGVLETVKKFMDNEEVCYKSKDGIDLFGGKHTIQINYLQWKNDIYIGFYDKGKGFAYFDFAGNTVFTRTLIIKEGDEERTERTGYHQKLRGENGKGTLEIKFEKDGKEQREVFLEVVEPIGFWRRLGRALTFKFRTPSTYYSLEGQRFISIEEIKDEYQISQDVELKPVSDSAYLSAMTPERMEETLRKERAKEMLRKEKEEAARKKEHPLGIVGIIGKAAQKAKQSEAPEESEGEEPKPEED